MNRRTFLKIAGIGSVSFAFGCNPAPKNLFTQVKAPDDMVVGEATWYASTCRECPAGCGILAKNREGRVVKIEGNPFHPINLGRLCMRGQAALQDIYNPDRLKTPLLRENDRWRPLSFSKAESILKARAREAAGKGPDRVRMLTETVGGSMMSLLAAVMQNLQSPQPLVFEPFAYESLKAANEKVFGVNGLVSYDMGKADVLLSFGADFLETWLSPVEYARKFKQMHAHRNGRKNLFFQISPFQSLTGANADHWMACKPGSESTVALGLVRQALDIGKGRDLPESYHEFMNKVTAPYTQDQVLERSGISLDLYEKLIIQLVEARRPLVLGTGTGASDLNGLQTNLAVNLLNLLLDPQLRLLDFSNRHRVEMAAKRSEVLNFFLNLGTNDVDLVMLNNVNPVFSMPPDGGVKEALARSKAFVVSFSNFLDETSEMADLILPFRMPLETWDEYSGKGPIVSSLQPAMGKLTKASQLGDVLLHTGFENDPPASNYKDWLISRLAEDNGIVNEAQWVQTLQQGGEFRVVIKTARSSKKLKPEKLADVLAKKTGPPQSDLVFTAMPSIKFFDGRGANKPWLCEIPDPLSRIAWQTPVIIHPDTAQQKGIAQQDIIQIQSETGTLEAPVYLSETVSPFVMVMPIGQGHPSYGRYASNTGLNPVTLLSAKTDRDSGGCCFSMDRVSIKKTGRTMQLAHTDGSRTQHDRTFALTVGLEELEKGQSPKKPGLTMEAFPLTLPLPEGYDARRDFYPPHDHETYRWGMVVDLDKCIGCGACAASCYAENNIGIVGVDRVLEGREMGWLSIERFHDPEQMEKVTFLPMLCQHCDNAPCESVCPVYAPHHSKEGINNQIYNRCIGTRFCVQNCPYKVRRFNWFDWDWPKPADLQLNPDVTVRSKGVMEKCSFCIQRIKAAHNTAKNEKRLIRDGEVQPACVQTCPTGALAFGSLMDSSSRVRKLADDPRAYQAMGYLNTKPAVIYLKKVLTDA
ncbi:MAG: 4Fe-4S dicluster domain-containing protein [Desulfobacteraceae bacterium]|jgi:molybdopterin-containing oxidoreductase family iron-sulfur binding subunit|nr:4Fe-4S dicluster domain-containing protein [Desulfobacteraceae bacterium]